MSGHTCIPFLAVSANSPMKNTVVIVIACTESKKVLQKIIIKMIVITIIFQKVLLAQQKTFWHFLGICYTRKVDLIQTEVVSIQK